MAQTVSNIEKRERLERSLRDALVGIIRDAGIAVIDDMSEGQLAIAMASTPGMPPARLSVRTREDPQRTLTVYKLMRLGADARLYPLYIDSSEGIDLGKWYDADSPDLSRLKELKSGMWMIDNKTGEAMSLADYNRSHGIVSKSSSPTIAAVNDATANGKRWIYIKDTDREQPRYGGERRAYYNVGITGGKVQPTYAMRPGWHAGSLPVMRQIGMQREKGGPTVFRDDRFVWVEGKIPADKDYNKEAAGNFMHDIPDHIPTDGYYLKSTNADAKRAQADRMGWYVAGSFKPERIISDAEARSAIDRWNISQRKAAQMSLIEKYNPMADDYHTGIRTVKDIRTLKEAIRDVYADKEMGGHIASYPDITEDTLQNALRSGVITVYSSHPIRNGTFVTPSRMQAEDYAGGRGSRVFSKEVPVDDIAWINTDEGQYAPVKVKKVAYDYDRVSGIPFDGNAAQYARQLYEGHNKERSAGVRFFKTKSGEAYGFTSGGRIYIDPRIATSETPIHEYTHLWASVLREGNPEEWKNIVSLMKKETSLWNKIRDDYPEMKTDDDIADEVLATYSGRRGAQRLREESDRILHGNRSLYGKGNALASIASLKGILERFWKGVCNFLHIHYSSAEEVADRAMKDLLSGVNPMRIGAKNFARQTMDNLLSGGIRYQIIGEKGARKLDAADHHGRMDNLSMAIDMEKAGKSPAVIHIATGWERVADGKWRYEIPDFLNISRRGNLHGNAGQGELLLLSDYINASDLFTAYPRLASLPVEVTDLPMGCYGVYKPGVNTFAGRAGECLMISRNMVEGAKDNVKDRIMMKDTFIHEIQHAIQYIEGFAKGGAEEMFTEMDSEKMREAANILEAEGGGENIRRADSIRRSAEEVDENALNGQVLTSNGVYESPYDAYHSLAGEVEARNVELRRPRTMEERRSWSFASTEDVSRDRQIVSFSGDIEKDIEQAAIVHGIDTGTDILKKDVEVPKASGRWHRGGEHMQIPVVDVSEEAVPMQEAASQKERESISLSDHEVSKENKQEESQEQEHSRGLRL